MPLDCHHRVRSRLSRHGLAWSAATVGFALATAVAAPALPVVAAQSPAPRNVVTTPPDPPEFGFEASSIGRDPARPGHMAVAYQEWTKGQSCYLSLSEDGGSSWTYHALTGANGEVPGARQFTQTVHQGGFEDNRAACENPQLAYGPDGTLYYLIQTVGEFGSLYLLVSHDGGHTFGDPVAVDAAPVNGSGYRADGHSATMGGIAVDQSTGRVFIEWMHGTSQSYFPEFRIPGDEVDSAYSSDGGRTFSTPYRLSPFPPQTYFSDKRIAVGPDGRVYAVWGDYTNLETVVVNAAVSSDHGATYSAPVVLGTEQLYVPCAPAAFCPGLNFDFLGSGHLSVAAGAAGHAFVTWWDRPAGGDQNRVMMVTTTDGGASWSPLPRQVGVPAGATSHHQWDSVVSVAPDGRVDVAFYDLAPDYTQDVYLMTSADQGATFSVPAKVTDATTDSREGPNFGGGVSPHPQPGMVSSNGGVLLGWTDPRRNPPSGLHQDVFVASTDPTDGINTQPPGPPPVPGATPPPAGPPPGPIVIPAPAQGGPVTPLTPSGRSWQVPWLSVDRAHPSHLAIAYQEGQQQAACLLAFSLDAGVTWQNIAVVGQDAALPIPGASACSHPEVEFTPMGGLAYAFSAGGHVYVAVAPALGQAFAKPVRADNPRTQDATPIVSFQPNLAVDPTTGTGPARIFVAYYTFTVLDFSSPRLAVATSNDGGQTFGPPASATLPPGVPHHLMAPAVDSAGVLYIAYVFDLSETAGAVQVIDVVSSQDHGASFGAPTAIATLPPCLASSCPDRYPTVSAGVESAAGKIHVVWATPPDSSSCGIPQTCAASPSRILMSSSADAGTTWSAAAQVAVQPRTAADDLILPALRVAGNGRLDMAYYERTPGGFGDGPGMEDTYVASSTDGGATFGTPRRVSDVSSNTAIAPGGAGTTFGDSYFDYLGLVALDKGPATAWTDSRRGTVADHHQDIYFADVGAGGAINAVAVTPQLPNTGARAARPSPGVAEVDGRPFAVGFMATAIAGIVVLQRRRRRRLPHCRR